MKMKEDLKQAKTIQSQIHELKKNNIDLKQ